MVAWETNSITKKIQGPTAEKKTAICVPSVERISRNILGVFCGFFLMLHICGI